MSRIPSKDDFEDFRGEIRRGTPGVAVGSIVEIEPEADGWHLFVQSPVQSGQVAAENWDIWCDAWRDAETWFVEWDVAWHH